DTDIFISTRKGSNEIALRLYSDLDWFGRKIIPADSKYNSLMETFVNPDFESEYTMRMKINNFLKRAENIDLTTPVNVRKINEAIYGHGKIKVQG
ncbi:hypothetical protein IJS77_05755, partial [bacterium]|nr:hypothetical protein [bacterium]